MIFGLESSGSCVSYTKVWIGIERLEEGKRHRSRLEDNDKDENEKL